MKKELCYNRKGMGMTFESQRNLEVLTTFFDEKDSKLVSNKILELFSFIGEVNSKPKYRKNQYELRELETAKINLYFEDILQKEVENNDKELKERFGDFKNYDLRELFLSQRTVNALRCHGFYSLGDVLKKDFKEISGIRGFGKIAEHELKNTIRRYVSEEAQIKYFNKSKD